MTEKLTKSIKFIFFSVLIVFIALSIKPVKAEEIDNQLTVLYESAEHDFSEIDVDYERINSVESVSDLVDVVHLKDSKDATEMIEKIKKSKGVAAVDYEATAHVEFVPNDKFYQSYQSYLKDLGYENVEAGNNTAKVAIVDTGVNAKHEDLIGRVEESGYNYVNQSYDTSDSEGHGTFIAGLIAANTDNSIGIAGATAQANVYIVPYVTLEKNGEGKLSDITAALEAIRLRDDIKVVNLSLGFETKNAVLEATCNRLASEGKILVAASGNDNDPYLMYPARYESVLSVGAVNKNNERCSPKEWGANQGSNYGDGLDLVAPGDDVTSISGTNTYIQGSGTSYSCPLVAAACALAATRDVNVNLNSILSGIKVTSKDLMSSGWDNETGYGLLQMDSLVNRYSVSTPDTPSRPDNPPSAESQIQLSNTELSLYIGEEATIEAYLSSPATVVWTSSNPLVAAVSNGHITALSGGTTTITAQINNGKSASCVVTVKESLTYQAHTANIGWMNEVHNGEIAGTTGQNRALEALRFKCNNVEINARAHIQNIGWMERVPTGSVVGTTGRALHMEALQLMLSGDQANNYHIYYRVHVQNYGWTSWARDGSSAGTEGYNLQIEAVEVRLIPVGGQAPDTTGDVSWSFMK